MRGMHIPLAGAANPGTIPWGAGMEPGTQDIYCMLSIASCIFMSDIPHQMSVEQVIDMIIDHGFADTYNFVYMPPSTGSRIHI